MKPASRVLVFGAIAGLILLILVAFFLRRSIRRSGLPDYGAKFAVPGLTAEVRVYRDSYGVPSIFAENDRDLYLAAGIVMAQDRLWQMDLLRRVTRGKLAEIFGEKFIAADLMLRALRIPEKSALIRKRSDPALISALESFARGVNFYRERAGGDLPPEFRLLGYRPGKWTVEDSLNLIGYMAWDLNFPWKIEATLHKIRAKISPALYRELIPYTAKDATIYAHAHAQAHGRGFSGSSGASPGLALIPPNRDKNENENAFEFNDALLAGLDKLDELGLSGAFDASNNWAISGSLTRSGKPILANDMHLKLGLPSVWYPLRLKVKGGMEVNGIAVAGQPMVVVGHNRRIAWGLTNVRVDDLDFYAETPDPRDKNRYLFRGKSLPFRKQTEIINVRGKKPVKRTLLFTHRGPVVSRFKKFPKRVLSMRWIGNEFSNEAHAVYLLNRAANWRDFQKALTTFRAISQNVAYADTAGNIGMLSAMGIPLRNGLPMRIQEGASGRAEWRGFLPFDKMPRVLNPPEKFVVSANNKPSHAYPHYISSWYSPPYRAGRFRSLLAGNKAHDVKSSQGMQRDVYSPLAKLMMPAILSVLAEEKNLESREKEARAMLASWDRRMRKGSGAALIFEAFLLSFIRNVFADELGEDLFREFLKQKLLPIHAMRNAWRNKKSPWFDDVRTKNRKENFSFIVKKSFAEALKKTADRLGGSPREWKWGAVHGFALKHPLGKSSVLDYVFRFNSPSAPVPGSFHTAGAYNYRFGRPYDVFYGASNRHIFDLNDWDRSLFILPGGVSGHPASPHYLDMLRLYLQGRYARDYFSRKLIREKARHIMKLVPNSRN